MSPGRTPKVYGAGDGNRTHVRSLGAIRHAAMRSFGATSVQLKRGKNRAFSRKRRQGNGLEFSFSWFVARRSIQLSYGRTVENVGLTATPAFDFCIRFA